MYGTPGSGLGPNQTCMQYSQTHSSLLYKPTYTCYPQRSIRPIMHHSVFMEGCWCYGEGWACWTHRIPVPCDIITDVRLVVNPLKPLQEQIIFLSINRSFEAHLNNTINITSTPEENSVTTNQINSSIYLWNLLWWGHHCFTFGPRYWMSLLLRKEWVDSTGTCISSHGKTQCLGSYLPLTPCLVCSAALRSSWSSERL